MGIARGTAVKPFSKACLFQGRRQTGWGFEGPRAEQGQGPEEPWGTGMGWDSVHGLQSISIAVFILPHLLYLFL